MTGQSSWAVAIAHLEGASAVPVARDLAAVLRRSAGRREGVVDVRIAGPDIVLSVPVGGRPGASVRVAGIDGAVQYWLAHVRGVVDTERSFVDSAVPVLERFVTQLFAADHGAA